MRVGFIDIDGGGWPNLALMKLSAYHKRQGDTVERLTPGDMLCGNFLFGAPPEKIYGAVVFTQNRPVAASLQQIGVQVGGSGIDLSSQLPEEIESMYPDYSLYNISDTAYGYLTRGCPRNCPFCIVGKKEGLQSKRVAGLDQFWQGQKQIKLLDPNLLACADHEELLKQLIDSRAWVDFTQGVDARLLTPDNIQLLKKIKTKMIHFAWDNAGDGITPQKLRIFKQQTGLDRRKIRCYVLTNYNSTAEEDLYRIYWLRGAGIDPYVMIYDKPNAPEKIRHMQRWVNAPGIFASCPSFGDYKKAAGLTERRIGGQQVLL